MFENKEICSKCGGQCCKSMPGIFSPDDFEEVSINTLLPLLKTGKYTFESQFFKNKCVYFLRPSVRNFEGCIRSGRSSFYTSGSCTFLTDLGCELSAEKRPYECKNLEPNNNKDQKCKFHGINNDKTILKWNKYQDLIEEILHKYEKEIFESITGVELK